MGQVSQALCGELVSCWDFLQRFGPCVGVSPVGLDAFVSSLLLQEGDAAPALEAAQALLRTVVSSPPFRSKLGIKQDEAAEGGEDVVDFINDIDAEGGSADASVDLLLSAVGKAAVQCAVLANSNHANAATWQQVMRFMMFQHMSGQEQGAVATATSSPFTVIPTTGGGCAGGGAGGGAGRAPVRCAGGHHGARVGTVL